MPIISAAGGPRSANTSYWTPKLLRNRTRDDLVNAAPIRHGWRVVRLWEHQATADMLAIVEGALESHIAAKQT